jgi:hypothetical protein
MCTGGRTKNALCAVKDCDMGKKIRQVRAIKICAEKCWCASVCTLNFGVARKNVSVQVCALNFGTVRKMLVCGCAC